MQTLPLKTTTIGMVSCFAALSTIAAEAKTTEPAQPNILFIFSDDHAIRAISAYGDSLNQTPNIDRIANDGVLFKNNFCANSICSPSRACILTGKHSHMNGQMTNWDRFDGSQLTFPKLLQAANYKTALIGKWHLKSNPIGFDHWMIYPGQGNYYNPVYKTAKGNKQITGYSVETTTDLAIDWISKQKETQQPFMLMCQYKAPHRTWAPGPKYLDLYEDKTFPIPETFYDTFENRTTAAKKHRMGIKEHMYMGYDLKVEEKPNQRIHERSRMTPEQKAIWNKAFNPRNEAFKKLNLSGRALSEWKYQRYIKNYLRCVAAVDDNVGRLLDYLKEQGLDDNTIVFYSSDQGFYLGEHGWFDKRWMYEESFRMPLVMKWPGVIKPGTVVKELTQNIDFAPTFLDICGIEIPEEMQGESLLPLAEGKDIPWRTGVYYHYYESPSEHGVPFHYGIRTKRYKLIHYYEIGEWELFDLQKDPQEMTNVYDTPETKATQNKLHSELKKLRTQYKSTYGAETPDPYLKKRLNKQKKKNSSPAHP